MNTLSLVLDRPCLARYTSGEPVVKNSGTARGLTVTVAGLTLAAGLVLASLPIAPPAEIHPVESHRVSLSLETVSITRPEPKSAPILEPRTILGAPEDRPAPEPETRVVASPEPLAETEPEPVVAPQPPARRVYGVRKVYARGLGKSGQAGGGLVARQGNSLGGAPDTLTATAADLQGKLAALSTVDQAPEPVHRVKPDYSTAMRKARTEGVVTAYVLVDTDGTVRDVRVTSDIGQDSAQVASAALSRFRFRPAVRHGQPVAVWILHRIRFEFQE
jgi:protein TonB